MMGADPRGTTMSETPALRPGPPGSEAPGRLASILMRFGTLGELMAMLVRGGRWWLLPLALVLGIGGLVLVVLQAIQYVAPFIYVAI